MPLDQVIREGQRRAALRNYCGREPMFDRIRRAFGELTRRNDWKYIGIC